MHLRRFTRLTNAYSKKLDNLKAAVGLWFAFYNFCRVHASLRVTPAMEAGIRSCLESCGTHWGVRQARGNVAIFIPPSLSFHSTVMLSPEITDTLNSGLPLLSLTSNANFRLLRWIHCASLCSAMENRWKVGDVVQLKSGSPKMTVTDVRAKDGMTYCSLFEGNQEKRGSFPADALQSAAI